MKTREAYTRDNGPLVNSDSPHGPDQHHESIRTHGVAPPKHAGADPLSAEWIKAIVDGVVQMLAGQPPRDFQGPLFEFRHSMCRSLRAMGLSEWEAYLQAREIEQRADHELCLIWDDAWAELP